MYVYICSTLNNVFHLIVQHSVGTTKLVHKQLARDIKIYVLLDGRDHVHANYTLLNSNIFILKQISYLIW